MSALETTHRDHHVLLVEDDEGVAQLFSETLRLAGYRVTWVPTAEEALTIPAYDILIADDNLGEGMSGLELLDVLHAHGSTTPAIAVSGHRGFERCRQAMRTGAIDFLAKPFGLDDLLDSVQLASRQVTAPPRSDSFTRPYPTRDLPDRALRELGAFLMERGIGPAHRARITSAAAQVTEHLSTERSLETMTVAALVDGERVAINLDAETGHFDFQPEADRLLERAGALAEDLEIRSTPEHTSVGLVFELSPVCFEEDEFDLSNADYLLPHAIDSLIDVLRSGLCDQTHAIPTTMAPTLGRLLSLSHQNAAAEVPQWS
jgi:DNA-binding response OmpR family regulator